MARLSEIAGSRELTINLTLRELRSRYKRSVLGWTWSLLNPLATVLMFTIIFSYFLKIEPPTGKPSGLHVFALFLLVAIIPWNFFSNGLTTSLAILVGNGNLIKKVYFPREVLVASNILSLVVTLLIELAVVCVMLLAWGNMVLPWIPVVLVLVVIEAFFVLGIGLALAPCNVYFRDVQHFVTILMLLLFYSAPIVYPIRFVPQHAHLLGMRVPLRSLYDLNPLVRFVGAYRNALYDLRFPALVDWAYLLLWAGVAMAVGLWVFSKLDRRLAEEV